MVTIYLTAANAARINAKGTVVGVEVIHNNVTQRKLFWCDSSKMKAKLYVLKQALHGLVDNDCDTSSEKIFEKVVVFFDEELSLCSFESVDWSHDSTIEAEWKDVSATVRRFAYPVSAKGKSVLSDYLYHDLCDNLDLPGVAAKVISAGTNGTQWLEGIKRENI